ncbi:MAG TPA: HAMP domain-containing protein, partial [Burkholderiaceae bacterium]|nr:HAMP domain-containing protein [Burkholderiaceae bacterium]
MKLRAAIMLAVVVGLVAPLTVNSLLTLGARENEQTQRLSLDHRRLVAILALGAREPLWTFNAEAMQQLLESLATDRRVVSATVRDAQRGVFALLEHPERRSGRQFTEQRDITYADGRTIGSVEVEMDTGQLDAEIAADRLAVVLTVVGQLLVSLVLIVLLLQARLLTPIRRLMRQSQQLARRELGERFEWQRRDELGELGSSLEETRQALQTLFNELDEKNRELQRDIDRRAAIENELQQHRERLEELVRERTAEL